MKNKYAFSSSKKLVSKGMSLAALRNSGLTFAVAFTLLATGCSKDTPVMKKSQLEVFNKSASQIAQASGTFNLGTAGAFTILSEAGVTATAGSKVTGNVGVGPIASTAITGFGLVSDLSNRYSTSEIVEGNGRIYAPDYAAPTPSNIAKAVSDMEGAFESNSKPVRLAQDLTGQDLSGLTLSGGTYTFAAASMLSAGGTLTLDAQDNENAKFVFQIGSSLTLGEGTRITLINGAQAKNILWVVGSAATFGTDVKFKGTILAKTAVTLNTKDVIVGRVFAQTAVTMTGSTVKPE